MILQLLITIYYKIKYFLYQPSRGEVSIDMDNLTRAFSKSLGDFEFCATAVSVNNSIIVSLGFDKEDFSYKQLWVNKLIKGLQNEKRRIT